MITPQQILEEYWGFSSFRETQEEIIQSILNKKNTIALLPTGGGKSICFQVPALILEGVCLVISPLIALMQDQVNNLKKRNIKAESIASGTSEDDIIQLFDNIKYGGIKFLYLSPERLQSNLIQQKLAEIHISFVAIDEAHCISEWGHDFRPSYRNINILREIQPNVAFAAFTATANTKVLNDIAQNLELKELNVFKKSFKRNNLAYQVFDVEDKLLKLEQIFTKTKTPAIVYVNSRKKTEQIAQYLNHKNFNATFYHGGLTAEQKKEAFNNWISESKKIMVATNAFGMGIDKNNVGIVIHLDLPFSLENYIQESGRAGRNGKKSFAVLLKNKNDILLAKEYQEKMLPSNSEIKMIHKKLYQFFQITYGEISEESFPISISEFSKTYNFSEAKVLNTIQILANHSIVEITNSFKKKSTIFFKSDSKIVQKFAINNSYIKTFINSLLRSYSGLFQQKVNIDEYYLSKKNNITSRQVKAYLNLLNEQNILDYKPVKSNTEIRFLLPREDDKTINRFSKEITQFQKQKQVKLQSFLNYITNNDVCRSIQILDYFDEKSTHKCGICNVCLRNKSSKKRDIENEIIKLLQVQKSLTSQQIRTQLKVNKEVVLIPLQKMISNGKIVVNHLNEYQLSE